MSDWFIPEPAPDPSRPSLLVYSSCHTHGILRYLNEHRPDIRARYNVSAVVIHLAFEAGESARTDPRFCEAFHTADFLINHPLAADKWAGWRADEIGLKGSCLSLTMESPQMSCFWPFLHRSVEGPVVTLLERGLRIPEIQRTFDRGDMDMQFAERYAVALSRSRARDAQADLKGADFVDAHKATTKMFFTENHPTMPVLGYMVDQFLHHLGHPLLGAGHALSLPLVTDAGDSHYPETRYEWAHYGFNYRREYQRNMGGPHFYHRHIQAIADEWMARGKSR